MKVKRANRLMSIVDEICVIHLQKVDTLLMIGIQDKYFHFIPVIMVLYIYKYWFKMLKQSKISTINHRQQIAPWVISLVLTTQYTYIQSMLNLAIFISFLLYKSTIKNIIIYIFRNECILKSSAELPPLLKVVYYIFVK